MFINLLVDSPASSSFASLPRDQEGFDDLDAYFNRAATPQKTPKSLRKPFQIDETLPVSKLVTPSGHRKTSSVLVAKPLKMISSKIAEHYKKEPRMAVSMSAVEAEEEEKLIKFNEERERELKLVFENENENAEQSFVNMMDMDMNMNNDNDMDNDNGMDNKHENINDNINNNKHDNININDNSNDNNDERVSRAKRELEEMSITSPYKDVSDEITNINMNMNMNDDTEVHLSKYIKTIDSDTIKNVNFNSTDGYTHTHNHSYTHTNSHDSSNGYYANDDVPDDVLMDRLVEEMLVNHDEEQEQEKEIPVNNIITSGMGKNEFSDNDSSETLKEPPTVVSEGVDTGKSSGIKGRKPKSKSTTSKVNGNVSGLSRRNMTYFPGAEINELGQRRGCRIKMEPLRYWANEKVCYGRAEDPSITLPVIVQVIKKPELDDPTFAMGLTRKRRRNPAEGNGNVNKLRAQAYGPECDVEAAVQRYEIPGEEEMRLVALSHHHVQGDPVKDCSFRIHTIFTEGSYMSSGQLIFPPASQKPTKNSARHALVFYVITGSFRVEINRTSLVIGPGGQFHVPRANHYTITHISGDTTVEGRLFFCHCKDNSE